MAFWNRKKNWEDEYDEYYTQDRRADPKKNPGKLRFIPHLLMLGLIGGLFVATAGVVNGVTMVEKLLTSLVTPVGIIWIALMLLVYFSLLLRESWPALIGFFCWVVLTIGGNAFVANQLILSLERPYIGTNVLEQEPFDTLVLLGGGTKTNLNGRSQITLGGDRVNVAAALFHAGKVKRIVCTGSQTFRSTPDDLHPREEAAEILLSLAVPQSAILQMKGNNTSEEMRNLKTWLAENSTNLSEGETTTTKERVGIVTSAWHMNRALRLANNNELEVEPVPANFTSDYFSPTPQLVIPSGENLTTNSLAIKEYLARLVGR